MPWKSVAQAAWGHSASGVKALGGQQAVQEWDAATPKGSLPKRKGTLRAAARKKKKANG
jgi:hypothetical protein